MQLAKIRTLNASVDGIDPHRGFTVTIPPWSVGWMEVSAAIKGQERGDLQMLAGLSADKVRYPDDGEPERPKRRRRTYKRRDVQAEGPRDMLAEESGEPDQTND